MLWKCLGRLSKISLNWRNWLRKNEAKKFHNSTLQYSENHWSKFVLMESSEFTWKNCRILSSFFTSCSMMNLCLPAVTKAETFQSLNLSTICKMWNRIDKYSPRRRWIETIAISSIASTSLGFKEMVKNGEKKRGLGHLQNYARYNSWNAPGVKQAHPNILAWQ